MSKKQTNHIHKLKRGAYKSSGEKFFFCTGDTCSYRVAIELALGKMNECWRCGKAFKLTNYAIRLAQPHCPECHNKKSGVIKQALIPEERRETLIGRREEDKHAIPVIAEKTLSDLQNILNNPIIPKSEEDPTDLLD